MRWTIAFWVAIGRRDQIDPCVRLVPFSTHLSYRVSICRQVGEFGCMDAAHSNAGTVAPSRKGERLMEIFSHSNLIGTNVSNSPGGSIVVDRIALATWSVDAMRVIRDQLYRAKRRGVEELPFAEHWPRERSHFRRDGDGDGDDDDEGGDYDGGVAATATAMNDLPLWASSSCDGAGQSNEAASREGTAKAADLTTSVVVHDDHTTVVISDLVKMTDEVSALLQSIEVHLGQQRDRRLDRLRPPSRLRRNWYLVAVGVPIGAYALYKLTREHGGFFLLKTCITKIADIYRDHVSEPLTSIYTELFTKSGRMDVTDRKARVDAIESLKRMIHSWLEESFPKMPLDEMKRRAEVSHEHGTVWYWAERMLLFFIASCCYLVCLLSLCRLWIFHYWKKER